VREIVIDLQTEHIRQHVEWKERRCQKSLWLALDDLAGLSVDLNSADANRTRGALLALVGHPVGPRARGLVHRAQATERMVEGAFPIVGAFPLIAIQRRVVNQAPQLIGIVTGVEGEE
jgi:hypothetical protein